MSSEDLVGRNRNVLNRVLYQNFTSVYYDLLSMPHVNVGQNLRNFNRNFKFIWVFWFLFFSE